MRPRPVGNRHDRCSDCGVRHNPLLGCIPDRGPTDTAAGAGDGVIHSAPFLKKYGA